VILRNFDTVTTEYYMKYVDAHSLILEKLEDALSKDVRFSQVIDFIFLSWDQNPDCFHN